MHTELQIVLTFVKYTTDQSEDDRKQDREPSSQIQNSEPLGFNPSWLIKYFQIRNSRIGHIWVIKTFGARNKAHQLPYTRPYVGCLSESPKLALDMHLLKSYYLQPTLY